MAQQQQRRSLKNIALTKKYHMPYMGLSILLALMLLGALYGLLLMHFSDLIKNGVDFPLTSAVIITTGVTLVLGFGIIFTGVLAAHRIAGVHIKMRNVFNAIEQGDLDTVLRFRKDDKLEQVEEAFNCMMDVIRENIESGGEEASPAS